MTALLFDHFVVHVDGRPVFDADGPLPSGSFVVLTGVDGSAVTAVLAALATALSAGSAPLPSPAGLQARGSVRLAQDPDGRPVVAAMTRDHGLLGALSATENVTLAALAHVPGRLRDRGARPRSTTACRARSTPSGYPRRCGTTSPSNSPAVSSNGSRSPPRSCRKPSSPSSTTRPVSSTRGRQRSCTRRSWLRRARWHGGPRPVRRRTGAGLGRPAPRGTPRTARPPPHLTAPGAAAYGLPHD